MTRAAGFSYVEVLMAVAVLAVAAVSAGYAVAAARTASSEARTAATARYLLQDGLAWVRSLPRQEPTSPVFGAEAGESVVDDVDDLELRTETAPTDRAGAAAPAGWQRSWRVQSVSLDDPTLVVAAGSTSLLRVRLVVSHQGAERAKEDLWLVRTR